MKFPQLEIEAFLAISSAKFNLADRGLVLIQGSNHADSSTDSNGAGKSSVPEALCWCLYGTTAKGITGDDVINTTIGKNCRVSTVAVDETMTYTITRHRKHKKGKNSLTVVANDGLKDVDLTKGTDKLTQDVVNQIIGTSYEVFAGAIYAGQEAMPDLPGMTDKQLKMLVEEAAGVTVLEGAYRTAREDYQAAVGARDRIMSLLSMSEHNLATAEAQIVSGEEAIKNWDLDRDEKISNLTGQVRLVIPRLKQLQTDIASFDAPGLEAKIKACDDQIASVSQQHVDLATLNAIAITKKNEAANAERAVTTLQISAKHYEDDLTRISHKVGCPCGECGRPITENELAATIELVTFKLENEKTNIQAEQSRAAALLLDSQTAASARDAFAATMTDVSAVSAQRASLIADLDAYKSLLSEQQRISLQARSLRDRIAELTATVNPYLEQLERVKKSVDEYKAEIAAHRVNYDEHDQLVKIEAEVVKVYAPAGVRARVLDEVTPFLNSQTAKYLSTLSDGNIEAVWTTLTPGAKGELKEKFSIDISSVTGGSKFKALSGGERRKVRISAAMALQDLVATRASKPIEIFIGDEIDDALDAAGLERLTMILEDKARERGSVFIISHNEIRDYVKQVVLIEKMPDMTTQVTEIAA